VLSRRDRSRTGVGVPTIWVHAPDRRASSQGTDVDVTGRLHGGGGDAADPGWTWAPLAPEEPLDGARFHVDDWAPASTVRHPWVRVGRFTLLYRRAA
jgi:hypothetical protein